MTLIRSLLLAGSVVAFAGAAQAAESYRVAGGPAGGSWHPSVSAGTQLLNKQLGDKYSFNYSPSNGSVDNVRRVRLGDADTGWAHVVQIHQSWNGTGPFEQDGKAQNYRIIANIVKQTQIIAVLADSPIKSYSDMEGKVVSLLNKGSGSNVNCTNVFKGIGMLDKIDARFLGFSASARALGDRQIDVFCSAGTPFTIPALTELSLTKPVRYISMTEEEQKKVVGTLPYYVPVTIPVQGEVKGMDAPARTIGYDVYWMVGEEVSDEAVYDMLDAVNGNLEQLVASSSYWKNFSGDFSALSILGLPVHPAAAKYWEEQGVDVPDETVKAF